MAFVARPAVKVTFTIEDQDRSSECGFYVGDASGNLVNIHDPLFRTFLSEFASSLTAVSDCFVSAINVSMALFNDAAISYGAAPDVERKGVLQFATEDGYQTIFTIPGAKYTMFGADGTSIIRSSTTPGDFAGNPLETHLESIHDKLRNGVTIAPNTYPCVDRRAKDIRDLRDAYKQHRTNSRG